MILLIDNYDSFSYNLYQLIGGINPDIRVIRNDEMTADEIMALKPSHIIVSPGPGRPCDAGVCEEVIKTAAGKIPILGVCLGGFRGGLPGVPENHRAHRRRRDNGGGAQGLSDFRSSVPPGINTYN